MPAGTSNSNIVTEPADSSASTRNLIVTGPTWIASFVMVSMMPAFRAVVK
jgi:hypothetical protein